MCVMVVDDDKDVVHVYTFIVYCMWYLYDMMIVLWVWFLWVCYLF